MKRKLAQNTQRTPQGRGKGKPFAKGDARINVGGRPRLPEEVRAALEVMKGPLTLKAIETLERNMDSPDGMVSNVAAREWLKKSLPDGTVKIQVEVSGPEGGPVETKVVQLDDSPGSLARVVAVLRASGVLEAGDSEGVDAEADAVDSAKPD